jgi:hypothetical protein
MIAPDCGPTQFLCMRSKRCCFPVETAPKVLKRAAFGDKTCVHYIDNDIMHNDLLLLADYVATGAFAHSVFRTF